MSKHANDKTSTTEPTNGACIVLYGLDENDKPRAARFSDLRQRELLKHAAHTMSLTLVEETTPALTELAAKLPAGRLYSNGRGFVPNVRRSLYEALIVATSGNGTADLSSAPAGLPTSWDDIQVGHLVIAQETDVTDGWWEAIVVAINDDMLTLRWRDYPKLPRVVRHRTAVTLLHSEAA
jgi:hypothetical protein